LNGIGCSGRECSRLLSGGDGWCDLAEVSGGAGGIIFVELWVVFRGGGGGGGATPTAAPLGIPLIALGPFDAGSALTTGAWNTERR